MVEGGRGDNTLFCTPPPIEFEFHRDQPPVDLETFIYQLPMEFNVPMVWPPSELNLKKTFWLSDFLIISLHKRASSFQL